MFHLALMGAQGFYLWNPIQFQVNGDDNQLFSDMLHELDDMLGPYCKARQWVQDWGANTRQPWVDSYLLTGVALLHGRDDSGGGSTVSGRRVWRLTISMAEHTVPLPDPRWYVISTHPLALRMPPSQNAAASGRTVTTITFGDGASIASPSGRARARESMHSLSRVGLWILEPAVTIATPLPNRTTCNVHGDSCWQQPWPNR